MHQLGTITRDPDGTWRIAIKRCVSCAGDHDKAELVNDGGVWYRCPKNKYLIYIREARG